MAAALHRDLALRIEDLDLSPRSVQVIYSALRAMLYAAVDDGVLLANPAARLVATLRAQDATDKKHALEKGLLLPKWVFPSESGSPLDAHNVRRALRRVLKTAKLPPHF